jgi:hypothetical protein
MSEDLNEHPIYCLDGLEFSAGKIFPSLSIRIMALFM